MIAVAFASILMLFSSIQSANAVDVDQGELNNAKWKLDPNNFGWGWFQSHHDGIQFVGAYYQGIDATYDPVATDGTLQYVIVVYPNGETIIDHLCMPHDLGEPPTTPPQPPINISQFFCDERTNGIAQTNTATNSKLKATYRITGYSWDQTDWFYSDGRIENEIRSYGPGIQADSIQPRFFFYWRYDIDVVVNLPNQLYQCVGGVWQLKTIEGAYLSDGSYCSGYEWKVIRKTTNKEVRIKVDTGDEITSSSYRPRVWALQYNAYEWDGGEGGLEQTTYPWDYTTPAQNIDGQDVVVWYRTSPLLDDACENFPNPPPAGKDCISKFAARAFNYS